VYTSRGGGVSYLLLSALFLSGGGSDSRLVAVVASESGSLLERCNLGGRRALPACSVLERSTPEKATRCAALSLRTTAVA